MCIALVTIWKELAESALTGLDQRDAAGFQSARVGELKVEAGDPVLRRVLYHERNME
jgi:hypothetical protein